MQEQASLLFYKFRFVLASILTVAFLMSISALVSAIGANTVLATNTPAVGQFDVGSDTPNVVTNWANAVGDGMQQFALSIGRGLYAGCRSITIASAQGGRSVAHGSAVIVGGVWNGAGLVVRGVASSIAFTARTVGSGILFMFRMPGRIIKPIVHGRAVSAVIRPADDESVPTISNETSAAVLARFNAQQQQEIASWQAAQLAANQGLGGSIVAGDPNHGGYPANWDNAAQDSMLDRWGMYNRECVSYAAWKVYQTYGNMPYWGGVGNANQWIRDARNAGIATGSAPRVHSVAISMRGYYGHATWVEKVSGNMIYVSQYNYDLHGHYSEMWVNASSFTYIYFK